MLSFHKKYARDVYSQNGEDGVIEEILLRLKIHPKQLAEKGHMYGSVCEFGAHDGTFCSNSRLLIEQGFRGALIEGDADLYSRCVQLHFNNNKVHILNAMVTPDNVNELVGNIRTVLSIDVDGIDYHIWKAYKGSPPVVIIEINSSLPPDTILEGDPVRGSSFKSMLELGISKGYFLVCHCGNMIFVRREYRDLFKDIPECATEKDYYLFFNTSWL